ELRGGAVDDRMEMEMRRHRRQLRRQRTRRLAHALGVARDLLQIGPYGAPELAQLDAWLADEHGSAQLTLERADGVGERGLGDATAPRSAGEVQLVTQRQEISDLMHFHWVESFFPLLDPETPLGVRSLPRGSRATGIHWQKAYRLSSSDRVM